MLTVSYVIPLPSDMLNVNDRYNTVNISDGSGMTYDTVNISDGSGMTDMIHSTYQMEVE
jgi:hypothetical protein